MLALLREACGMGVWGRGSGLPWDLASTRKVCDRVSSITTAMRPMSAVQIWDEANALGIAEKVGSKGKTPRRSIRAQFFTDSCILQAKA